MGVSVIIPCRNQASTLERAVKSAFAAGADEVLVYNDGGDTESVNAIMRKYWHEYNDLGTLNYRHGFFRAGVSYARNVLIEEAKGDWIIPLDADDELLRIPGVDYPVFAYGGWVEHYEDGHEETFAAPPFGMLNRKPLCHATMMFSKDAWKVVGGYDPDFFYGEDYAFQCALAQAGYNHPSHLDYPIYKRYVGNNPRTDKAMKYWPIIQEMAKEKYPSVFS